MTSDELTYNQFISGMDTETFISFLKWKEAHKKGLWVNSE